MPGFDGVRLTRKGINLLAKCQLGQKLEISKAVVGDGELKGVSIDGLDHILHPVDAPVNIIGNRIIGDGSAAIEVRVQSGNTAFYFREIGIIANDPDDGEILYAYANAGEYADYIPSEGKGIINDITLITQIGSVDDVEISVSLVVEVSREDFENEQKERERKADKEFNKDGGFAGGGQASATKGGFAGGKGASSVSGGAGGLYSKTETGGSLGQNAESKKGLAAGLRAKSGDGVAAGADAMCGLKDDGKTRMDNIQIGAGTNNVEKSAKFYEYTMMNPDGTIPKERLSLLDARRYATVVIGTTQSGYETGQVDYLCDGSNDADIINQAIQSLPTGNNANGGTVQLLPGEYVINGTIHINNPGVTIMGAGAESTVFVTTAFESAVIKITSNFAEVKNIGIYQSISIGEGQGMGIYITTDNAYDVNICHCNILGYYYGVNITNAGNNISVCNNQSCDNTIGLHINSRYCNISTNYLPGNSESGIRIEGSKNMITNNMITRANATGGDYYIGNNILLASGASDNMIVNNMILGMDVVDNGTNNLIDNNKY